MLFYKELIPTFTIIQCFNKKIKNRNQSIRLKHVVVDVFQINFQTALLMLISSEVRHVKGSSGQKSPMQMSEQPLNCTWLPQPSLGFRFRQS